MVRLITTRNNPDLHVFEAKNVSIPNQIVLVATVATQNFSCPSNSSPTRVQFSNIACMAQSFFSSTVLLPIKNVQKFYKKFEIQKGPLIGMFFLNTRLQNVVCLVIFFLLTYLRQTLCCRLLDIIGNESHLNMVFMPDMRPCNCFIMICACNPSPSEGYEWDPQSCDFALTLSLSPQNSSLHAHFQ